MARIKTVTLLALQRNWPIDRMGSAKTNSIRKLKFQKIHGDCTPIQYVLLQVMINRSINRVVFCIKIEIHLSVAPQRRFSA